MDNKPPILPPSVPPCSKMGAAKFHLGSLTDRIIACAIAVHKQLGPGFLEKIYENAFALALRGQRVAFEQQATTRVYFDGQLVGVHRLDLVVERKVIVELKAVQEISDAHIATCLSYLKATDLEVALLINFAGVSTQVRRVMRKAHF